MDNIMLKQHKDLLVSKYVLLVQQLCVDEIFLSYLRSERVITEAQEEELMTLPTRTKRASSFVNTIQRRGPRGFQVFVEALMHSEQEFLARELDPRIADQWLQIHPRHAPPPPQLRNWSQPVDSGNMQAHGNPPPYVQVIGNRQEFPNFPNNPRCGHRTMGNLIVTQPEEEAMPSPSKKLPDFDLQVPNNTSSESAILNINVLDADVRNPIIESAIKDSKNVYEMRHKPRGRAIIINNEIFTNDMGNRSGSMWDYVNLDMLFSKLGFETDNWSNLTGAELLKRILMEKDCEDHRHSDAFFMVIMSHGIRGSVYGTDGTKILIEDHILQAFSGRNCPALMGKPKVFLIQACQGSDVTSGFVVPDAPDPEYEQLMEKFKELQLQDNTDSVPTLPNDTQKRHEMADILLAYSTAPGFKSWRHPETGTWFVREFVQVCNEFAHDQDLMEILRRVRQRVAEKQTDKGLVQITRTDEMLTKKLYFFPGYFPM